ncbi:hypothetical protein E2C01_016456 [Portunus trituberculatus]|uniref:Uncharacterized protein n=1 Tax=Portunus trituberculatus TaxID=210409 RepID=A0A5B7DP33_PORTR|nr:hypothetical protein [Portunus trituberculatus]
MTEEKRKEKDKETIVLEGGKREPVDGIPSHVHAHTCSQPSTPSQMIIRETTTTVTTTSTSSFSGYVAPSVVHAATAGRFHYFVVHVGLPDTHQASRIVSHVHMQMLLLDTHSRYSLHEQYPEETASK